MSFFKKSSGRNIHNISLSKQLQKYSSRNYEGMGAKMVNIYKKNVWYIRLLEWLSCLSISEYVKGDSYDKNYPLHKW